MLSVDCRNDLEFAFACILYVKGTKLKSYGNSLGFNDSDGDCLVNITDLYCPRQDSPNDSVPSVAMIFEVTSWFRCYWKLW